MKVLLLTDVPPCTNYTAGLVLNQLCQFIPPGGVACFTAMNGALTPAWDPKLDWMPRRIVFKPGEFGLSPPHRRLIMRTAGMVREYGRRAIRVPRLIDEAVAFGREQKVDAVWAVLQGQTMVRMARPVARRLKAPLYTQVWDPLSWWLKAHLVDPLNRSAAQKEFAAAVRASVSCATASWPMADAYCDRYGVRTIPVIASLDPALARPPALAPRRADELIIGMAGQFYAQEEWHHLIDALNHAGWRIAGRNVRIRVFSKETPAVPAPADKIEHRGFIPQSDLVGALAEETDVLYCPYPFQPAMAEVARLSFPSKLPIYLASGRPVVFHGPDYSAAHQFLQETGAAVCARGVAPAAVYNAFERLVTGPGVYHRTAAAGAAAFETDFTIQRMRSNFFEFLGVPGEKAFADPAFSIRNVATSELAARRTTKPGRTTRPARPVILGEAIMEEQRITEPTAGQAATDASQRSLSEALNLLEKERIERMRLVAEVERLRMGADAAGTGMKGYLLSADLKRAETANEGLLSALRLEQEARAMSDQTLIERESQIAVLQKQVAAMQSEQERLNAVLLEARAMSDQTLIERESHIAVLQKQVAAMQSEQERLNAALLMATHEPAIARVRAEALEAALQREISLLRREADLAALARDAKTVEIGELRAHIDKLQAELAVMRTDLAVLTVRKSMGEEMAGLRTQLETIAVTTDLSHAAKRTAEVEEAATRARDELTAANNAHVNEVRAGIEYIAKMVGEAEELKASESRVAGRISIVASSLESVKRDLIAQRSGGKDQSAPLRLLYLDLLEASLCGQTSSDPSADTWNPRKFDSDRRLLGRDWPQSAQTMIGSVRLRNIRTLLERVLDDKIPGDFLEAGVWRGGACIYARGILLAHGDRSRKVWVADSFRGLPPPDLDRYPNDTGDEHFTVPELAVSAADVRANFQKYGLLDTQVEFLEGWFKDTLPDAPVEQLSILRLDGDMYGSTMETLEAMYHRVSPGGFVIVDDYILKPCREAIMDFRKKLAITDAIEEVDGAAVYWRKTAARKSVSAAKPSSGRSSRKPAGKTGIAAE